MARVSVANTDTQLLAEATERCYAVIFENEGSDPVWINKGGTAVVGTGFLLSASQPPLVLRATKGELADEFRAIADSAGSINVSAYRIS